MATQPYSGTSTLHAPVLLALGLALLFLVGCFTPNMRGPCCTPDKAVEGQCEVYTPAGADTAASTYMCNGTVYATCQPNPSSDCKNLTGEISCESCNAYISCSSICTNGTDICNSDRCYVAEGCYTNYCVVAEVNKGRNSTIYKQYFPNSKSPKILNCSNYSPSNTTDPCNQIGYCLVTSDGVNFTYPICTSREQFEYDTDCKVMLCGNIKYAPQKSILPEPAKNPFYQGSSDTSSFNLYNAKCDFFVLDNKTMRKLKKAKNVFVNTLRIGVGSSISDFEEARLYLPLSDRFCGFMNIEDAAYLKDRYMNYLDLGNAIAYPSDSLQSEVKYSYRKFNPSTITNRSISVGCDNTNFPPTNQVSSPGNYMLYQFTEGTIAGLTETYLIPDNEKYKFALYSAYWDEIFNKFREVTSELPTGMRSKNITYNVTTASFECQSASDCISGLCTTNDWGYERAFCVDSTGTTVNCLCHENGTRQLDGNVVICEPYIYGTNFTPAKVLGGCSLDYACKEAECVSYDASGNCVRKSTKTDGALDIYNSCNSYLSNCTLEYTFEGTCQSIIIDGEYDLRCVNSTLGYNSTALNSTCNLNGEGANCVGNFTMDGLCISTGLQRNCGETRFAKPIKFLNESFKFDALKANGSPNFGDVGDGVEEEYIGYAIMDDDGPYGYINTMFAHNCKANKYLIDYVPVTLIPPYEIKADFQRDACLEITNVTLCTSTNAIIPTWSSQYTCEEIEYCTLSYGEAVLLKSLGDCQPDDGATTGIAVKNFPKLENTYGWCEPCTFATMFGVDLDTIYNKYADYTFNCPPTTPSSDGMGPAVGASEDYCGPAIKNYISHLANFRNRMDNYFKAGVIPVVWYTDGELDYTYTYSGTYKVGEDCNNNDCTDCVDFPETSQSDANIELLESTIKSVLLGPYFYYLPDYGPFFETSSASCTSTCDCVSNGGPCFVIKGEGEGPSGESYISSYETQEKKIGLWSGGGDDRCCSFKEDKLEGKDPEDDVSCSWSAGYHFLRRAIGNSAAIVIVATDDDTSSTVGERAMKASQDYNCPNCLIAIYSSGPNTDKLDEIFGCSGGEYECQSAGTTAWNYIDVILYDLPLNYDPQSSDEQILDYVTDTSRELLQRYSKPSMPYDFTINDALPGWNGVDTYFLKKAIDNGAEIVIVATDDDTSSTVAERAMEVSQVLSNCPYCLIAIYSSGPNTDKLNEIFGCNGAYDCYMKNTTAWNYIHLVLYDLPFDYNWSSEQQDYISNVSDLIFDLYLKVGDPYDFVEKYVVNYTLPSRSGGDTYNRTYSALTSLLTNQTDIVRSGIFGFLYKRWSEVSPISLVDYQTPTTSEKDLKFCAFEQAIDRYLYPSIKKTLFRKAISYENNTSTAECVECTETEILIGKCNASCENGLNCTLPTGVTTYDGYRCKGEIAIEPCALCNASSQIYGNNKNSLSVQPYLYARVSHSGSNTNFEVMGATNQWIQLASIPSTATATFCIYPYNLPDGCRLTGDTCTSGSIITVANCSDAFPSSKTINFYYDYFTGKAAVCNFSYPNDTITQRAFPFSILTDIYGDVIASIPKEDRCCLTYFDNETNSTYNYTYAKTTGEGMLSTPVTFPRSGDETIDCGLGSDEDLSEFCGVEIPMRDYAIDCSTMGE